MFIIVPRCAKTTAAIAATVAALVSLPGDSCAQPLPNPSQEVVSKQESDGTVLGNYLAGYHAHLKREAAFAYRYYRMALKREPRNADLLELSFYAALADGQIDEGVILGKEILQLPRGTRVSGSNLLPNAQLLHGVRALKQRQFQEAQSNLKQGSHGSVADLIGTLLSGWAAYGANKPEDAVRAIDRLAGPDWYAVFKNLHTGLILDLSGNQKEAGRRFDRAYKLDPSALRVTQAYGAWLSRNGRRDEALRAFETFDAAQPRHPQVRAAMEMLQRGQFPPRLVDGVNAGAAEALYGLGAALARREEELSLSNRGLSYLQLALYLEPNNALALLSLADLYEAMKKPELAIRVYSRVPDDSPLRRKAEIQVAINLDSLERTEEARQQLSKLIANHPDDLDAILALGNILRERKVYNECGEVYSRAIAQILRPAKPNWTSYYFRGICYERSKQWERAEPAGRSGEGVGDKGIDC